MTLASIRDYISTLGVSDAANVYQGKMPDKPDKAIGVYNIKRNTEYTQSIGGDACRKSGVRRISTLIHWNCSPRETEEAATAFYNKMRSTRNVRIGDTDVAFVKPLSDEPIDVGCDAKGIYEMVCEFEIYYNIN